MQPHTYEWLCLTMAWEYTKGVDHFKRYSQDLGETQG